MEYQKYIAYYRVSTAKQGRSGLSLEAKRAAVISFINIPEGIIWEFTDNKSGKNDQKGMKDMAIALFQGQDKKI